MKTSEANVQKACCDFLSAKKVLWFRMNAGDRFGETNGKKWRIKGHEKGTADLLALVPRVGGVEIGTLRQLVTWIMPFWIEVKAPGKKQRPEQIEFQKRVEEYGCSYLLVDNVDTLINWFKERGL